MQERVLLTGINAREATTERWNVYVVADYGKGDAAFAEVAARFRAQHGGISAEKIAVPPFSTLSTGFWIAQMGLENAYPGMVIFSNTAPRGTPEAIRWQGDERQRLLFGILDTGVPVCAISTGYNWSFVKHRLSALYELNIANSGSQFRSRDIYPQALARILARDESIIGNVVDPTLIPDVPLDRLAYTDGYGNIKTTTRASQFKTFLLTQRLLKIRIGSASAVVYNHLFGQEAGVDDLGLVGGSSGGKEDPFLEIIKRGGSAAYVFGNPSVYDERGPIEFSPL